MNLSDLQRALESDGLRAVYLVHGPETFLRTEAVQLICKAALSQADDTDILELDGGEVEPCSLLDDLRTPGLFAPRRLLIVENSGSLLANAGDLLLAYVEKPASGSSLVLVTESVDARKKGMKKLLQKTVAVACPTPKQRELPSWCIGRARMHGKRMDPGAARMLVDLAGENMGRLDGHLEALTAYCRERQRITAKDVSDLIGGDHARTVWELVRAISARSPATALRALNRLLRDGTKPPWIIAALAHETRLLWHVKSLLDRGRSAAHIQEHLGKPDWLVRRILQTVRNASTERLRANHGLLLQADMQCKTGQGSDRWIVENLVLQLCGAAKTGWRNEVGRKAAHQEA